MYQMIVLFRYGSMKEKISLKQAREKGKMKQFMKERGKDTPPADRDRFDDALKSMTSGKSLKARKPSKKGSS